MSLNVARPSWGVFVSCKCCDTHQSQRRSLGPCYPPATRPFEQRLIGLAYLRWSVTPSLHLKMQHVQNSGTSVQARVAQSQPRPELSPRGVSDNKACCIAATLKRVVGLADVATPGGTTAQSEINPQFLASCLHAAGAIGNSNGGLPARGADLLTGGCLTPMAMRRVTHSST